VDALGDRVKRLRARRIGETKAVLGAPQLDITSSTAKFGLPNAPDGLRGFERLLDGPPY